MWMNNVNLYAIHSIYSISVLKYKHKCFCSVQVKAEPKKRVSILHTTTQGVGLFKAQELEKRGGGKIEDICLDTIRCSVVTGSHHLCNAVILEALNVVNRVGRGGSTNLCKIIKNP